MLFNAISNESTSSNSEAQRCRLIGRGQPFARPQTSRQTMCVLVGRSTVQCVSRSACVVSLLALFRSSQSASRMRQVARIKLQWQKNNTLCFVSPFGIHLARKVSAFAQTQTEITICHCSKIAQSETRAQQIQAKSPI